MRRLCPLLLRKGGFFRIAYVGFRLVKYRTLLIITIVMLFLLTVYTILGVAHSFTVHMASEYDPAVNSPIVRSTSWNQRGLSSTKHTSNSDVTLLALIHASGSETGHKRREVIRKTWLSDIVLQQLAVTLGTRVSYKFILGGKYLSKKVSYKLNQELQEYNDMIILDDTTDEHRTLTRRTLSSFTYIIENNFEFKYILKCDDDTFVNLRPIMSFLVNRTHSSLHWGSFVGGYNILRNGPYAEHSWFVCDCYFPYAFGGGYIISRDLIELLAMNAPYLNMYSNEDVAVSSWLAPYNIERIHDLRFDTQADSHGCMRPFIVAHKIPVNKMREYFISLQTEGIICGERTRTHELALLSHYYNWKALPIKDCCTESNTVQLDKYQLYV